MEFLYLKKMIDDRGIKKTSIARKLRISERTLRHKLNGETPFTWEQAQSIQKNFFPDIPKDELFATDANESTRDTA